MVKLFVLAVIGTCIVGSTLALPHEPQTQDEIIEFINSMDTTWKAGKNFDDKFLDGLMRSAEKPRTRSLPAPPKGFVKVGALPDKFDVREKFGKLCPSISKVRDQGACLSDWAISATSAITDRICIFTEGKEQAEISPEYMMSCCEYCVDKSGGGCQSGHPESVWDYYQNYGVITGGEYGTKEGCQPYSVEPCEHHGAVGKYKACADTPVAAPKCTQSCVSTYNKTIDQDRHYGSPGYTWMAQIPETMQDLIDNGPLVAQFEIFADFLTYKSGIYQFKTGKSYGLHSVKLVGWGTEGGIPYWTAINSFNSDWGDKGEFRIRRDIDECGFNTGISGGKPIKK